MFSKPIPKNADVVLGGFPCQAFSIAGYQKGFNDERGSLFFRIAKIIEKRKPKAIFLENVKNLLEDNREKIESIFDKWSERRAFLHNLEKQL